MAAVAVVPGAADAAPAATDSAAGAAPRVDDAVLLVTAVPTRVLRAPAAVPNGAALQVVVVPGNPGDPALYTEFVRLLWRQFGGAAEVLAVGHAGHDGTEAGDARNFTLECQIQHKVDLFAQHLLLPGRPPAVVVAHSIGAYIMLHALARLDDARDGGGGGGGVGGEGPPPVARVVLRKPFLRTNPGCARQALLRAAARRATPLAGLAERLARAPAAAKRAALKLAAPGVEAHAAPAVLGLLRRGGIMNIAHLALHEFEDLNREFDWDLLRRLGPRAAVIAAPGDMWHPRPHFDALRAAAPEAAAFLERDLTHAFCVSARQSDKVARMVAALAAPALAGADDGGGAGGGGGVAAAAARAAASEGSPQRAYARL